MTKAKRSHFYYKHILNIFSEVEIKIWYLPNRCILFFYHLPLTYICRVGVTIKVRVKGVKRIPIDARRDHYAIEEIFTSANMTMMELDK